MSLVGVGIVVEYVWCDMMIVLYVFVMCVDLV